MICMTERLYETDQYCHEFVAIVISVEEKGGRYEVVLDKVSTSYAYKASIYYTVTFIHNNFILIFYH